MESMRPRTLRMSWNCQMVRERHVVSLVSFQRLSERERGHGVLLRTCNVASTSVCAHALAAPSTCPGPFRSHETPFVARRSPMTSQGPSGKKGRPS